MNVKGALNSVFSQSSGDLTPDQFIQRLRKYAGDIENYWVWYAMRRMGIRYLRADTIELMKVCIALHEIGLPITTNLTGALLNRERVYDLAGRLHTLGDKHALLLRETEHGKFLEWTLHPEFIRRYYGKADPEHSSADESSPV